VCAAVGAGIVAVGVLFSGFAWAEPIRQANPGAVIETAAQAAPSSSPATNAPTAEEIARAVAILSAPTPTPPTPPTNPTPPPTAATAPTAPSASSAEEEPMRSAATTLVTALALIVGSDDGSPSGGSGKVEAVRAVQEALSPARSAGTRAAVAEQIALRLAAPPRALTPSLAACLDPSNAALCVAALRALGRYQSRDAVRPILDGLLSAEADAVGGPILAQATDTLAAQTGLLEFGSDLDRWRRWWSKAQWLSEQEWRTQISRSQAVAAETLRRERADSLRQMIDLYRRLHSAAPEAARSELLAEMMASGESEVRKLGVDFAMRALLNGKPLDDTVAASIAARLTDPSSRVREGAASVLDRLNRPAHWAAVKQALRTERDSAVAAALLRTAAHEPDESLIESALAWLAASPVGGGVPTSEPAIAALLAAHTAGLLRSPEHIASARGELLRLYPDRLTPGSLSLMTHLGEKGRVIELLSAQDIARAQMAASALVDDEASTDALVSAGSARPPLREAAVRSLMRWRLTADGFATARSLIGGDEPGSHDALIQYARALPAEALLLVARQEREDRFREELLAHAVTPENLGRVGDPTARIELLVLALQTRLALGRAADALSALDATPTEWLGPRLRALRVTSLLCLDRVEDALAFTKQAAELGADAAMLRAWVDALAYSIDKPFARRIHDALIGMYPEVAASGDASRFHELAARIPPPSPHSHSLH